MSQYYLQTEIKYQQYQIIPSFFVALFIYDQVLIN